MSITDLQAKAAHLEKELQEVRKRLAQETQDPAALANELSQTRSYAFSAETLSVEDVAKGCNEHLERYGFCVIDNVIPTGQVKSIREEVKAANAKIGRNRKAVQELFSRDDFDEAALIGNPTAYDEVELRRVRRVGHLPKIPNEIVWMPQYAQHLASPYVVDVARRVLDDHLRIAQLHTRFIETDKADGTPGGFGAVKYRGRADTREWHTDWPHDLSAYGAGDPGKNVGCIRRPFPNVAMCLVMIWYLTDVDEESGGTWVVPGSHKDERNPRGPADGMTVTAPIPGDMQVSAPAGSVYIQDSRSWHSSAMHNPSGRDRIAIVNRWCPWWLSVDDYAPRGIDNTVCNPLSHAEYLALPAALQPFMRHLCPDEQDTLQQPVLERANASSDRTRWGFQQLEENPNGLAQANDHVRVTIGPS
ncbi:MAG: phytanoyl-CoA dioxygenase family protein [Chloroflexota bacterium]